MSRDALLHPATLLSAAALGIDSRWLAGSGIDAAVLHHGGLLILAAMVLVASGAGRVVALVCVGGAYTLVVGCPPVTELVNAVASQWSLPTIPAASPVALLALVIPALIGPARKAEELTLAPVER